MNSAYQYPVVIQARCSSSRLPSKVLLPFVANIPTLLFQYKRLSHHFPFVIVATSTDSSDDPIFDLCTNNSMNCYRGSLNNVMSRLLEASSTFSDRSNQDCFVRVGGDDPLISPEGILLALDQHLTSNSPSGNIAMTYTSYDDGLPYGCACEIFSTDLYRQQLAKVMNTLNIKERDFFLEHTKPSFNSASFPGVSPFAVQRVKVPTSMQYKNINLSIDYPEDFLFVSYIANHMYSLYGINYSHDDLIHYLSTVNDSLKINNSLHDGFGE